MVVNEIAPSEFKAAHGRKPKMSLTQANVRISFMGGADAYYVSHG